MRNRMTLASVSIVVVIVAASSVSVQPGSAQTAAQAKAAGQAKADACLARPGASAPKGSHWYYRIERPSGRRCWYLGAANQRVVRERAIRTERPVPMPVPAPAELRADERTRIEAPAAGTVDTNATATTTASTVAATQFSAAWPVAPHVAPHVALLADPTVARAVPTVGSQGNTQDNTEAATTVGARAPSEAPPADRAAAQPPPPGVLHLAIFLSAVAAFVGIAFRAVLKLAAAWRGQRNRISMPLAAGPSIEAASEPTIERLREIARRWETPTRVPRQPRLETSEMEPHYAVEGAALRRQRRVA